MFDRIYYYYFNANYEKCLELSENFLDKEGLFALEYCVKCALKLENFDKAAHYARQLFQLKNTSFNGLLLAKSLAKSNTNEAINLLETLTSRQDELLNELCLELAFLYKQKGENLEKAEEIFKNLLKNDIYNLDLWKSYAELYFKNDFQKALNAHDELCEFGLNTIEKLKSGELVAGHKNNFCLQERLQEKTQENATVIKLQDFLNTQILPQKAYLLFKLFRLNESLNLFEKLSIYNQNSAQFWQNYAKVLELSLNYQGAYDAYQRALNLHPHATYEFDLAYLLMRMGVDENFEEGKKLYESRLFYAHNETFSAYHYNKSIKALRENGLDEFKDKEILVFCEQGFGDTIMYARCLERLCELAAKVLFAPQSALYTMFKNQIKILNKNNTKFNNLKILKDFPQNFDYALPICSLPFFLDIKMHELALLQTPIIPLEKPKNKKKKIGIFWFTPNALNSDLLRNFEFDFLYDALKNTEFELISFQIEGDEVKNLPKEIQNRGEKIKNFDDSVKNLSDIDLFIGIDSAITHLALALQIPTIVLLKPRFDWRWGKFENPKSLFWPKAEYLIYKEKNEALMQLKEKIAKILKTQI